MKKRRSKGEKGRLVLLLSSRHVLSSSLVEDIEVQSLEDVGETASRFVEGVEDDDESLREHKARKRSATRRRSGSEGRKELTAMKAQTRARTTQKVKAFTP